jgi:hypothetical protein
MCPKRTTEGSYDSLLTEIEYATRRSMPIEIGQAPDSGHTQPAAEGNRFQPRFVVSDCIRVALAYACNRSVAPSQSLYSRTFFTYNCSMRPT